MTPPAGGQAEVTCELKMGLALRVAELQVNGVEAEAKNVLAPLRLILTWFSRGWIVMASSPSSWSDFGYQCFHC